MRRFSNRFEAGRILAIQLDEYAGRTDVVLIPVRMRASSVAEGIASELGVACLHEYATRETLSSLEGRTAILVDDGFDSIDRIREAAIVAHGLKASRVVAAAPVGNADLSHAIARLVDELACLATPVPFHSTGFWYVDSFDAVVRAVFAGTGLSSAPRARRTLEGSLAR